MKGFSALALMHLRVLYRPAGRSWLFDFGLIYFATYAFFGSNIPGVFMTWPQYTHLSKKMFQSEILHKRGLQNTQEFLDDTHLQPEWKSVYYRGEMAFARYF